jgi:O-antigen/teichoic acid export membrane protein
VFSAGLLFFLTIPASIAGWILGNRAKRLETGRDQANVAVIIAIVGLILGVIAAAVWILLVALGEYTTTTEVDHSGEGGGLHFDVIRLVLPGS